MFNLSTQEVVSSIRKSPLVNLDGIYYQEYKSFFGKEIGFPEIKNRSYKKLEKQEHMPRSRLDYGDVLIRQFKMLFMNRKITEALEKKFKVPLEFDSVDIWKDLPGYHLEPHTDDPRIKLAIQIYLGDDNVGTSLFDHDNNTVKSFLYSSNSGYALLNNSVSRHGTSSKVTRGERISLYARYR